MAEDTVIAASRMDIDDVVFSAMTEVASTLTGLSVRDKTKFAIMAADRIMLGIDDLGGAAKRSEAAKRAAAARYSKPQQPKAAPTPGPAIPKPETEGVGQTPVPGVMPTFTQQPAPPEPLAPPPHPSLAPGNSPFGAPPA